MSWLSSIFSSLRKSSDLRRISLGLALPYGFGDVTSLIEDAANEERSLAELLDLIQSDSKLSSILDTEGADREDLKRCYIALVRHGAGQWAKGHWIAASGLAFANTLPFILQQSKNGRLNERDNWQKIVWSVLDYFENGRVGALK
jgi:hypothetical protein